MVRLLPALLSVIALGGAVVLGPPPRPSPERADAALAAGKPSPEALRWLGFEHAIGLADLMWLQTVQLLGTRASEGGDRALFRALTAADVTTDLDPRYFTAYYAPATVASAFASLADASDALVKKGKAHLPGRYEFDFMLGWNDYFIRGRPAEAAEHWTAASRFEEAPHYLPSLAGRARLQAEGSASALRMLKSLMAQLPEGRHREMAAQRIELIKSEHILEAYDEACARYRAETGRNPDSPGQLHLLGYIEIPPLDRFGERIDFDYDLDADGVQPTASSTAAPCVARTSMIPVREFEARENIGKMRKARPPQP
jgi:hypothetical protein